MGEQRAGVALITGCGSPEGIGFATARRLAGAGFAVAITSTTERIHERARQLQTDGHETASFVADLTSSGEARELVKHTVDRFGRVDVLVNNAGIAQVGIDSPSSPFAMMSDGDWAREIAVNLTTAVNVTRPVIPDMIDRGYGRIVNVSSVTGPMVAMPNQAGYATSKAGMDGLTRALAIELGPHAITVNSVAPGWIHTAASSAIEDEAGRNTPLRRPGTADEVAAVIAFLTSRDASYITGQVIVVDGGNIIQEDKGPRQ